MDALYSHMGADFFPEASKIVVSPKMALAKSIPSPRASRGGDTFCPPRGGVEGGKGGGTNQFFAEENGFL